MQTADMTIAARRDSQVLETPPQVLGGVQAFPWANFRFPPFPASAVRALKMVSEENTSMRTVSDLISSDPALASEVLIIANSALLAQRHPVTSILQAAVLLGTRTLKGVCLTVAVRAYMGRSMHLPSLSAIWRHSLASALIAEQLASAADVDNGTAYTAGILYEIGRFALAVLRPEEYAGLIETHSGSAGSLLEAERSLFGFDHREAGLHLAKEWKLPLEFENMLRPRSQVKNLKAAWKLGDLIEMSGDLAAAAGFPAFPGCEVLPYADLLDAIPLHERALFHADEKRLASDIRARIGAIEGH